MELADFGVTMTRAKAAMEVAAKKRKVENGGGQLNFSPSLVQLRSRRRRIVVTAENSTCSAISEERTDSNDPSASPSSYHVLSSCSSSNASSEVADEKCKFVDLEAESAEIATSTYECDFDCGECPATSPSTESGELEPTAKRQEEVDSRLRSNAEKTPSPAELDEFFAAAEKDLQKRFMEKYNYDIVKDEPLEGRYEWVQLKP